MWRTDVYKQLEYIRSKYGGSKQYIVRSEEEIDFGRYVTEQESSLFGGDNGESGCGRISWTS